MEEIEVKFLNIDPKLIKKKLKDIGAKKIFSTYQVYRLKGINVNDYKEITFKRMVKN